MASPQDDEQQRFALGLIFALVAAVVIFAITFGYHHVRKLAAAPAATAPAATVVAPAPAADAEAARVVVVDGIVKFYFATGKSEVATGANEALAEVVKGIADGKMALISGFHDATGDAAVNAELAKQRAFAVRDVLKALGVAEDKLTLQKPEETMGSGSMAEARRVEVKLQ
jgi:outer membrane protein OmpA-like peptidoglycan-associated protein